MNANFIINMFIFTKHNENQNKIMNTISNSKSYNSNKIVLKKDS